MGKLDDLEHDTHEDEPLEAPVPPGLNKSVTIEPDPPTDPRQAAAQKIAERRKQMKESSKGRFGIERPWLHPENPALWEGEGIDNDDD